MTLPASGAISISQISTEIGRASNAATALNETPVRSLAGVASGAISMSNFHGRSSGGQQAFTTAGTYSFVVPAGVTSICGVFISAGQRGEWGDTETFISGYGGRGGSLRYINNMAVTPGETLTIEILAGGLTQISRGTTVLVKAGYDPGSSTSVGAVVSGGTVGGGTGGVGGNPTQYQAGGGGGAGGYSGDGGAGQGSSYTAGAGTGGGGGGGHTSSSGSGGGGVGIYGQGANGAAGTATGSTGGGGGSGGSNGVTRSGYTAGNGGNFGGGGGGGYIGYDGGIAGGGAARIIWGAGRAFPSTLTGDI